MTMNIDFQAKNIGVGRVWYVNHHNNKYIANLSIYMYFIKNEKMGNKNSNSFRQFRLLDIYLQGQILEYNLLFLNKGSTSHYFFDLLSPIFFNILHIKMFHTSFESKCLDINDFRLWLWISMSDKMIHREFNKGHEFRQFWSFCWRYTKFG